MVDGRSNRPEDLSASDVPLDDGDEAVPARDGLWVASGWGGMADHAWGRLRRQLETTRQSGTYRAVGQVFQVFPRDDEPAILS